MTVLTDVNISTAVPAARPRSKIRMLEQMAEALEDEAAGLYRRAAAFEEEEFLLNREIETRQTEINRLMLKLDAMRAEHDRAMERIDSIQQEANAMREEVFAGDESSARDADSCESGCGEHSPGATFFRRMTLAG